MTNVFRRFFKISTNKKGRKSSLFSKLELITLEDRITPVTFPVTNNNDSGLGSLRQAIIDANAASSADDIIFTGVTGTITLNSSLPLIVATSTADTLTITGPGSSNLTISGDNGDANRNFAIFKIDFAGTGGNLSISGVTVSGAKGNNFSNNGNLTVTNCTYIMAVPPLYPIVPSLTILLMAAAAGFRVTVKPTSLIAPSRAIRVVSAVAYIAAALKSAT